MSKLKKVLDLGQSIWLDFLDRDIMSSGELKRQIDEDGIRGLTSNPAIFEKAISNSSDYNTDIAKFSEKNGTNEEIFYSIAIKDIQQAADTFKPIYDRTNGGDGFVSLEVSPDLAKDTEGTIKLAKDLWKRVDRKNLMVKIPGTAEGLPAIRECISAGINVNVTLLFGLPRYKEVTEAYLQGLEDRLKADRPIDHIASVASFFLSRIDVMIDPMLKEKELDDMVGEVAIASAKGAYGIYEEVFYSDRFKKLEKEGAKRQRLLWASTGTKDPSFSDVKYVEALIGKDTVDTMPMETLEAFRDHGNVEDNLKKDMDKATKTLNRLKEHDIDIDKITQDLEDEGIDKFTKPFDKLLKGIEQQKKKQKA